MKREFWKPKRKEIEEWFEKKILEFLIKENHNTRLIVLWGSIIIYFKTVVKNCINKKEQI